MKLSIIIPVFNNWNFTKNVLNFFYKNNSSFFELIIIDNGSSDGTQNGIKEFSSMVNLIYIRNDKNLGFGAAMNQGYKVSHGDSVLFLNNDIMIAAKDLLWLEKYVDEIDDNSLVGPTGGLLDQNFNFIYETSDKSKAINYMSGWFLCAKRSVLDRLTKTLIGLDGPFDNKSFFVYFEDADLSFRANELNIKFVLKPVPVHHIGKQTSKKMGISGLFRESKIKFSHKWSRK